MKHTVSLFRTAITLWPLAAAALSLAAQQALPKRNFQPEDLFHVRQVGGVTWSADGLHAAIELTRPDRALGSEVSNEMGLLDVKSHALRTLSSNAPRYVGFFNPKWSPDGRRLAFLSVDMNASVQAWIWTVGADVASPVGNLDIRAGFNDPPMAWVGNDRIAMLAWDVGAAKSGNLYAKILRGGHMVDEWKRAADARLPTVSVLESGRYTEQKGP